MTCPLKVGHPCYGCGVLHSYLRPTDLEKFKIAVKRLKIALPFFSALTFASTAAVSVFLLAETSSKFSCISIVAIFSSNFANLALRTLELADADEEKNDSIYRFTMIGSTLCLLCSTIVEHLISTIVSFSFSGIHNSPCL